jgi:hypothetical protein
LRKNNYWQRIFKYGLPVIIALVGAMSVLFTDTSGIEKSNYFNRFAFGDAHIYMPDLKKS